MTDKAPIAAATGLAVMLAAAGVAAATGLSERSVIVFGATTVALAIAIVIVASAAWRQPLRRRSLGALAVALLLWTLGTVVLQLSGGTDGVEWPLQPSEWLYLASYGGFAAFLLLDARRRADSSPAALVESVVVTCGAACLAGLLLLIPAVHLSATGLALAIALIYPICDILLVLLVLSQLALRERSPGRATTGLLCGFVLLAVADATYAVAVAADDIEKQALLILLDVFWCAALLVIALAGAERRPAALAPRRGDIGTEIMFLAAIPALAIVVWVDPRSSEWPLLVPAFLTIGAVAVRAAMALRAERKATDAYRATLIDNVTGAPNRRGILESISSCQSSVLALVELSDVGVIVESFGHERGDEVMRALVMRLREVHPRPLAVGRVEGAKFAAVLPARASLTDAVDTPAASANAGEPTRVAPDWRATGTALKHAAERPIQVEDVVVELSAGTGIAIRRPGESPGDLLRRARVALAHAESSPDRVHLYAEADDTDSQAYLHLASALRRGLAAGELEVWYQPQVEAITGKVHGVEGLVRWNRPDLGIQPPAAFLAAARHAGLMPQLTEIVATQVMADAVAWQAKGHHWRVSFNVAPAELLSGSVMRVLIEALDRGLVPPGTLVVEVTEESFMSDPDRAREVLAILRERGVEVAIDDYGTGFSSLSYLRALQANELKIDQSFVSAIASDERSAQIVTCTIQMAHVLDMRVVAEGVETAETAGFLTASGADTLQGYLLGRPMPRRQLEEWVARRESQRQPLT